MRTINFRQSTIILFVIFLASFSQAALVDRVSLGGGFASLLEKRGVIYYKDFQVAPVIAAYFFDRKVEYLTDSIGYRQFLVADKIRWRSSLHYINDDPLFPKHKNYMHRSVDRPGTFEWMNRLEFYFPSYSKYQGEFDLGIAKDLKEHSGLYLEASGKIKVFEKIWNIIPDDRSEINLFATLGYATEKHNEYLYGHGAREGFTHFSTGIWINFPDRADRYTPIVMVKYFEVLDSQNRNASWAFNNNHGWMVTLVGALPVY